MVVGLKECQAVNIEGHCPAILLKVGSFGTRGKRIDARERLLYALRR